MRCAILRGTIVGPIWMPSVICSKHVAARIERSDSDTYTAGGPYPSLREAMLALTNDGDFQACGFVPGDTWLDVIEETWSPAHDSRGGTRTLNRRVRVRDIQFACWDTEDFKADEKWLAEWDGSDD